MKTLRTLLILAAVLTVAACEYSYRYKCQDPNNWEKKECNRPDCEVDGTCSDVLVGKQITELKVEETESKVEAVVAGDNCENCPDKPQGE